MAEPQAVEAGRTYWNFKLGLCRIASLSGWLAILGSLTALFADTFWLADMFTHLRMQYVLISAVVFGLAVARGLRFFAFGLLICFGWNLWIVSPYLSFGQPTRAFPQDANSSGLKLVIANVLRTNQEQAEAWKQIAAEDADFVYLMEVHNGWDSLFDNSLATYPYQRVLTNDTYTGVTFLSKHAWESLDVYNLGVISNPSIKAKFRFGEIPLTLIATHPVPPFGSALTESREQQLVELANKIPADSAGLLTGDLNVSPWSPSFRRILEAGNLDDATRSFGPISTIGPLPGWFGGLKFDHVLANSHVVTKHFEAKHLAGSDHRMLIFEFEFEQPRSITSDGQPNN